MKGIKKKLFILIIGIFLLPMVVYGKDYTYYYDELLKNNEFVVHTDIDLANLENNSLYSNIIGGYVSRYGVSYIDITGANYYYQLRNDNCNQKTMKCDFILSLQTIKDGKPETKDIKKYEGITIKTDDTGMSDALSDLVTDNKLMINYDESMLQSESEKLNYIYSYLNNKSNYNKKVYNYDSYFGGLYYKEIKDELPTITYLKKIDEIKFEYKETPYSTEFKELTSNGEITINTNVELSRSLIQTYLSNIYVNSNNFELNGELANNKAYVARYVYENGSKKEKEKHLVTFKKGDVDLELFKKTGLKNTYEILSDNKYTTREAVISYVSSNYYHFSNPDGSYISMSYDRVMTDPNKVTFKSTYSEKNGKNKKYQFYVLPINYVGYSKDVSKEYKKLGDKIVVNSNDKSENTINSALGNIEIRGYNMKALNCNADFSECDVLLINSDTRKVENHRMKIEFNDKVSDYFKNVFNLSENDTIDIVMDGDINLSSINLYMYNEETQDSYSYNCYGGKCTLTLRNYYEKRSESHKINLKYNETGKSKYYKKNVVDTKTIYPGENPYPGVWGGKNKFSKTKDFYTYADNCNKEKGTCDVYILTENYGIEVHRVNIDIKEGKSPEYENILPGDTIEVPYVKTEDESYIYHALSTYLSKNTKANVYVNVFDKDNDKAQIIYNDMETHSFKVKFAKPDKKVQEAINKAADNIAKSDKTVFAEDLDLVNSFYYNENGVLEIIDSAKAYKEITSIINNKHITYQTASQGGGYGDQFESFVSLPLILYYDGIGYGLTKDNINYTTRNVIYIPSNTKDTVEDYIKAAQKRINDYLGKDSDIVIQYSKPVDEEYLENGNIDLTHSDKNVYNLIHKDKIKEILILKDDSKIEKPNFVTQDVNNNIVVESNNVNYPNDTVVSTYVIEENTKEYKDIIKSVKAETAQIIDISLYSPSAGDITKFDGANFKVTVPVTNKDLLNKALVAYYINDEGKVVSEHPVTVKDGMATFETTHFSTYVITEKKGSILDKLPEVPLTLDAVSTYVITLGIGIVGMVLCTGLLKKRKLK